MSQTPSFNGLAHKALQVYNCLRFGENGEIIFKLEDGKEIIHQILVFNYKD